MIDPIVYLLKSNTKLWLAIALLAIGEIVMALCIGGCGNVTAIETNRENDAGNGGGSSVKGDGGRADGIGSNDSGANRNDVSDRSETGSVGGANGDAGQPVQETGDGATSGLPDTQPNPMADSGVVTNIGQRCGNYATTYYIACCPPGVDCAAKYGKRDQWCDCATNPPADGYTTCELKNGTFGSLHPTECVLTR